MGRHQLNRAAETDDHLSSAPEANDAPRPASEAGCIRLGGDLQVCRLGFGAMRLVGRGMWGTSPDPATVRHVLRRAVELAVNLIDTADAYGPEIGERLIAEALFPYPSDLVLATKGGLLLDGPWQWRVSGRPDHLRAACEASLRRLRLECIDLYQLHAIDPEVPVEESVGALADLQTAGKIRYIGLANVNPTQLDRARSVATIVSVQNRYNLADRGSEDVLAVCEREGIAFMPWSPLADGALARPGGRLALAVRSQGQSGAKAIAARIARYWPAAVPAPRRSRAERAIWALVGPGGRLNRIARDHAATPAQIALAWLLRRSPVMLPIPGSSSIEHLDENVAAASSWLDEREFRLLSGESASWHTRQPFSKKSTTARMER